MKKIAIIIFSFFSVLILTSCNDWLDVLPNNEQVSDKYWQSKEDVEAVVTSGYVYMRQSVPTLIKWGELRGGALLPISSTDLTLLNFTTSPSNSLCNWSTIYKCIGMANSVIKYAPQINDRTYTESMRRSHMAEAYFMRAYCYFVLMKTFKEVPLITEPYVDDKVNFEKAKSSEEDIIKQIKADLNAAISSGAAKSMYEEEWQTKGRVTNWALYALMADVCVWTEEYEEAIKYCDLILNAQDLFRPAFLANTADWFTIFYPGNSNEGILELNWDAVTYSKENNFGSLFGKGDRSSASLYPSPEAVELMRNETQTVSTAVGANDGRLGRMLLCTYVPAGGSTTAWPTATEFVIWKYYGNDIPNNSVAGARPKNDANFIIYRVAEIILLKAQAEIMLGRDHWKEAVAQINRIRNRAGLDNFQGIDTESATAEDQIDALTEQTLIEEVLEQKELELMAEGKRWYDLLWLSRIQNHKYLDLFVGKVISGNRPANEQWVTSVLQDEYARYLPIPQADIDNNKLLKQNPYYSSTTN